jgi:UDP-glucuronate 4-epimerase
MSAVLVTGAAGFIGYHTAKALLDRGLEVLGLDNMNNYYDVSLKETRLRLLQAHRAFRFLSIDVANREALREAFDARPEQVVHLAAQAGVRYSIQNPAAYVDSNLVGFANILEECRRIGVRHLVYASSSSVYGTNAVPFSERDGVDHPTSIYAATKRANELLAHGYSHLFGLPTTGLRFFTVYGPWGRPDMAPMIFAQAILAGQPISLFNNGLMERDFTYVDAVVEGIVRVLARTPAPLLENPTTGFDPSTSAAPFRIFNLGNSDPVTLTRFVHILERALESKAKVEHMPMQPGDVARTCADMSAFERQFGPLPSISLEVGLEHFARWFRGYYYGIRPL